MMREAATELLHIAKDVLSSRAEKEVERLLKSLLKGTPFAGKAFATGGYVRDEVMGLDAKDLDIAV
jgi:tRNA nucleotidyltransferase/poly(A) polymerase